MTIKQKTLLVIAILLAGYFGRVYWLDKNSHPRKPETRQGEISPKQIVLPGTVFETEHYAISSTATPVQTKQVAEAVERFYSAYSAFFEKEIATTGHSAKLKMMLYKDRQEFSANNTSSPWAEAYYRAPVCYAYFSDAAENPYHWMIHEATHQLNKELAGFKIPKWINEGLASYFGASRIEEGVLLPGKVDDTAYPIWWLGDMPLSGNLQSDIDNGRIIPLRALISGKGGPDIGRNVNLYYIEYWSFTHFLFHHENGKYAQSYRKLIVAGGSLESFETIVGPIDRIQGEWYAYLQKKVIDAEGELAPEVYDAIEVTL